LQVLEGNLGLVVAVTNLEETSGGIDINQPGATSRDRQKLQTELLSIFREQAEEKLSDALEPGGLLFPDTLEEKIINEIYDPPIDQPGKRLELTLVVKFTPVMLQPLI